MTLRSSTQSSSMNVSGVSQHNYRVKIPPFDDVKDNLDDYLRRFERYVVSQQVDKSEWALHLSTLLKGKALEVYSRLSSSDALDYDILTKAFQKRYQLTEEGFRTKFRACKSERAESPIEFVARLSQYFSRWAELSNIDQTYDSLANLILKEQFLNVCNQDIVVHLKEKKLANTDEMAGVAEIYMEAHNFKSFGGNKMSNPDQSKSNFKAKDKTNLSNSGSTSQNKTLNVKGKTDNTNIRCYICQHLGHKADRCTKPKKTKTVASVGLTPSIRTPPGRGGHGNQLLYRPPPRAGGVTLGFHFGISSDKLLKFAACFH